MTEITVPTRDRTADYSDAVVAAYIHEISAREPARRTSPPSRPSRRPEGRSTRRSEARAAVSEPSSSWA